MSYNFYRCSAFKTFMSEGLSVPEVNIYQGYMVLGVPGVSGNLVVKRKLPPRSGSSLEAVEPHP